MTKPPDQPESPPAARRDSARRSKKDPAKPTRAKANRPAAAPIPPALADLLNPGIQKGTAGLGSQTGLEPPADNSRDRRADFAAAHKARLSTPRELGEAPQAGYVGRTPLASQRSASAAPPPAGIDRELAEALGSGADEPVAPAFPAGAGVSATMR